MNKKALFELGFVTITPDASLALAENGFTSQDVLNRHVRGDWGDITEREKQRNDTLLSLKMGQRLRSVYIMPKTKHYLLQVVGVWILTESATYSLNGAKRVTTAILMADNFFDYKPPVV